MRFNRKVLMFLLLAITAIMFIGCDFGGNNDTTTTTTAAVTETTTEGEATEGTSTTGGTTTEGSTITDGLTTTEGSTTTGGTVTTDEVITTPPTDTAPYFTGLFTKQTYYRGSQDLDLLAGAKALDAEDGELDISIVGGYSATRLGTYNVFAVATDSDNNVITEQIILTVKDVDFTIPETFTDEDITIELWHSNGTTIEAALNSYATSFMGLYENVTVNIVKSGNNYDELRENVINAIRGGQIPNIVQNYPDHVMEYIDNEALITITPFIYHPIWGYDAEVENESFLDIVLSYRQENSQYTTDGEFYSLPFNKSTEVMIYNKTMMDALIADGVIDEVPTTWQGLLAIADDLTAISADMIDDITDKLNSSETLTIHKTAEEIQAIKDNFVPMTYDSTSNAFITLLRQWGGEFTTIDSQRQGVILLDNDETRNMLNYFFDARQTLFTIPAQWGVEYGSDAFKTGQTAITFGSTGGARYNTPNIVDGELVFEFGVAPMPYNADMPEERTAIQQGTNMSITTTGSDQEKLASWLFLKYLTSYDIQLDFALTTGYSPVRTSVYTDQLYLDFTNGLDEDGNPVTGEMLMKSMAANAAAQQATYLFYDQAYVGSAAAREAVGVAFERVILQALDGTTKEDIIEDAIAYAKSEAERVLT